MKTWAIKRMQQMEANGAPELARMFELVARICELDEQLTGSRHGTTYIPPVHGVNTQSPTARQFA
ncbi:MAG: hypothetical protein HY913_02530 [Desulfomonile tiedjei]|nr:hypothetical protein [Desulfomonile tiedjei]